MRSSSLARSVAAKYTTCLTDADSTGPSSWRRRISSKSRNDSPESARLQRLGRRAGAARQPTIKATPGARVISAASVPSGCRSDAYFPSPLLAFLRLPTLQAVSEFADNWMKRYVKSICWLLYVNSLFTTLGVEQIGRVLRLTIATVILSTK